MKPAILLVTVISLLLAAGVAQDPKALSPSQIAQQTAPGTASWRSVIDAARPAVVVIRTDKALGSGFLIKSDGTIVTNAHVIAGSSAIEVKLSTGEIYRRTYVLASDEAEDIALLRIEAADVPALKLGSSSDVKVGDDVMLVGAPLGLEETISTGIVSAIRVSESGNRVIQTTAAASPGSSGGPLLNNKGEVIGIISASIVKGQNLNFAIPINYVRGKLDVLSVTGSTRLVDSSGKPLSASGSVARHSGVMLTGMSGPGTPQGSFAFIYVQLLDFLSAKGVDVMNETASFQTQTSQVASLNYYLEHLPASGASGLLYMIVERPRNYKYIIRLQCFDSSGKLLWEEKESKDGWSETGATSGVLDKIEKKLLHHIGSPGLTLKTKL